jgi:hypothetical protein
VAPSTPADVKGLLASSIRDDDPVVFLEAKSLYAVKGEVPDDEHVEPLGRAMVHGDGDDVVLIALASMVPKALEAAERLRADHDIGCRVVDLRCLVPLDVSAILAAVRATGRVFTVEENPRLCTFRYPPRRRSRTLRFRPSNESSTPSSRNSSPTGSPRSCLDNGSRWLHPAARPRSTPIRPHH